jgi:hypothetical protein
MTLGVWVDIKDYRGSLPSPAATFQELCVADTEDCIAIPCQHHAVQRVLLIL